MRTYTDMHVQARDGYIHVRSCTGIPHHPWNIVRQLRDEGVRPVGGRGADKVVDEIEYEERWQGNAEAAPAVRTAAATTARCSTSSGGSATRRHGTSGPGSQPRSAGDARHAGGARQ
jgi:hypothetical protein